MRARWTLFLLLGLAACGCLKAATLDPVALEQQLRQATPEASGELYFQLVDYYRLRDPGRAVALGAKALSSDPPLAPLPRARILAELAYARMATGAHAEALRAAKEAMQLSKQLERRDVQARATMNAGSIYMVLGFQEQAMEHYFQALRDYEALGQDRSAAYVENNIGVANLKARRFDDALGYFRRSLARAEKIGSAEASYGALGNIGITYSHQGKYSEALGPLRQAQALIDAQGDGVASVINKTQLAVATAHLGNFGSAMQMFEAIIASARAQHVELELPTVLQFQAEAYVNAGRPGEAEALLLESLSIAQASRYKEQIRRGLNLLVTAYEKQGKTVLALQTRKELQTLLEEHNNELSSARIAVLQVEYDTEKKENELIVLRQDNEIKALALAKEEKEKLVVAALALAGFLVTLSLGLHLMHRRRLSQERLVNEHLRRLDQLKDQLLANTSHELRTPLNGIMGLSEQLLEQPEVLQCPEVREKIAAIAGCGNRLTRLVGDIMDMAQLNEGSIDLHIQPTALFPAVQEVVSLNITLASGKDIHLENHVRRELPDVSADPERLQQILYNLVGNAVKFTEHGLVIVDAQLRGSQIEISVQDSGAGIPPTAQERLFKRFEQGDSSMARRHGGAGLGLAISKMLVELQGGSIGVESWPGQGSRFYFTVPVSLAIPVTPQQQSLAAPDQDRREESVGIVAVGQQL